jgi:hypothetical protein
MMLRIGALLAAVVSLTSVSAALAQDVEYGLTNSSSLTLIEFYTSAVTDEDWGDDLLANVDVAPGVSGSVIIADGSESCDYDLLFVFEDGTEVSDTVDICELASYELTD